MGPLTGVAPVTAAISSAGCRLNLSRELGRDTWGVVWRAGDGRLKAIGSCR
jgi:hypothetical protein